MEEKSIHFLLKQGAFRSSYSVTPERGLEDTGKESNEVSAKKGWISTQRVTSKQALKLFLAQAAALPRVDQREHLFDTAHPPLGLLDPRHFSWFGLMANLTS